MATRSLGGEKRPAQRVKAEGEGPHREDVAAAGRGRGDVALTTEAMDAPARPSGGPAVSSERGPAGMGMAADGRVVEEEEDRRVAELQSENQVRGPGARAAQAL